MDQYYVPQIQFQFKSGLDFVSTRNVNYVYKGVKNLPAITEIVRVPFHSQVCKIFI